MNLQIVALRRSLPCCWLRAATFASFHLGAPTVLTDPVAACRPPISTRPAMSAPSAERGRADRLRQARLRTRPDRDESFKVTGQNILLSSTPPPVIGCRARRSLAPRCPSRPSGRSRRSIHAASPILRPGVVQLRPDNDRCAPTPRWLTREGVAAHREGRNKEFVALRGQDGK